MSKKLISIILPVYNGEKYLAQATQSILNQTYSHFELIIINDGSKDHSEAIALDIQKNDSRVIYLKNENNIGLIQTLNRGLLAAKGNYIARMDQDDIAHPKRLEIQLKFLENLGKPGIVGSNILVINSQNKIVKIPRKMHATANENSWVKYRKCPLHHPTVMISREIVEKFQPFYSTSDLHIEDYAAWLRVNQQYPILNIERVLLFYRIHTTNISTVYFNAQTDQIIKTLKSYYMNDLKIDVNVETLRSLLFLQLSPLATAEKIFNEVLASALAYTKDHDTENFVKADVAYSIFSMGLKSILKTMPAASLFIVNKIGPLFLFKAMRQTAFEGIKAIFFKPFLIRKYSLILNPKSNPTIRNF